MPSITEDGAFTVIIEFDVDPTRQEQLVEAVADEVARTFPTHTGFLSASFHASLDGRRVVNYAQWTSREAWEQATSLSADDTTHVRGHTWLEQQSQHNPVAEILHRLEASTRSVDAFRVARVVESS